MTFDWDWSGAEAGFRRALDLSPSLTWPYEAYALGLAERGRVEEAISWYEQARELDPLAVDSNTPDLGELYALKGEDEKALAEWNRSLELEPDYQGPHRGLGRYYCQKGMAKEGLGFLKRAVELSPDDPLIRADLAHCHAVSGQAEEARRLLGEIEAESRRHYVDPAALALIHLGLGERENALAYLEAAYEAGSLMLPEIGVDSRYDTLESEKRFQDLLHRIGLLRG
jgi:tetratricopeptide (TPR) repeat protein